MSSVNFRAQQEKEAEEILRAEGFSPALPIPAKKCGSNGVGNIELVTNVHGMKFAEMIPVYRYDVTITGTIRKSDGVEKQVEMTKKFSGDAIAVDRRDRCRDVFYAFVKANRALIKNPTSIYYDLQSIMYSLNILDIPQKGLKFTIPLNKLPPIFAVYAECNLEIRRVIEQFQLTIGDLSKCLNENLDLTDHSLLQFLDVATSQHILFAPDKYVGLSATKNYLIQPDAYNFGPNDTIFFEDNGAYLAIGTQKSIRFMEGPKKNGSTALILESKKTPFHVVENLLEKVTRMVQDIHYLQNSDYAKIEKICTGLCVEVRHLNRPSKFYIKGLDREGANTQLINVNGQDITVENYYQQKYNIRLSEPNIPLLRARGINNTVCYIPIELCFVVDNQRVKTNQQTPKQVQDTIKKCAVPPAVLIRHNIQTFNSMEFASSEYLKNAGISIRDDQIVVRGNALPLPELEFSNRQISSINTKNFTWQGRQYLIPEHCSRWVAYAFVGQRDRLREEDFTRFLGRFIDEAKNHGMRITDPTDYAIVGSCDVKSVKDYIKKAAEQNCTFAFIVHPDFGDDIHSYLKLSEREFSVVTQAIRFSTLMNMILKGQPLTLSNIVNKTNIKLGGLNYTLSITSPGAKAVLKEDILFIGFGMNHSAGGLGTENQEGAVEGGEGLHGSAPSVVGYCANVGLADNFEFVGDFIYQPAQRDEKVSIIRTIVQRCIEKYRRNRRGEPKSIVLYRNGCSEGNFPMVLRLEVPLIKITLEKLKCTASLVLIIPNKLQSVRFIPSNLDERAKAADQNVKPGTVVDHSIVHPVLCEFFLTSHRALQGTTRTPKYTVLVNEPSFSLQDIEQFTHALCYGHQIVNMPTSLPSPVYIALRYAERGRKLYNVYMQSSESDHSRMSYEDVSETLGYYHNESLATRRINA